MIFEKQYVEGGFDSQRKYPNTSMISAIAPLVLKLKKPDRKELRVLEIGCGSGANLWMLADEGLDTYGLDASKTGLKLCKEMLEERGTQAKLFCGDMTSMPFESSFFDVIIDVVSMQHLTFNQHLECVNEIFRCLKYGGTFFSYHLGDNSVSFNNSAKFIDHCTIDNIPEGYPLSGNGPTCFLSRNEVKRMLSESSFEEISIERETKSYNNSKWHLEYLSITALKTEMSREVTL